MALCINDTPTNRVDCNKPDIHTLFVIIVFLMNLYLNTTKYNQRIIKC